MQQLHYTTRRVWKYQLSAPFQQATGLSVPPIHTEHLVLAASGVLTVQAGYCWDGPSGPALDTPNFMRASLVHDALYQLIRLGELSPKHRVHADQLMYTLCRADGMGRFRAHYSYYAVCLFGRYAIQPEQTSLTLNQGIKKA